LSDTIRHYIIKLANTIMIHTSKTRQLTLTTGTRSRRRSDETEGKRWCSICDVDPRQKQ
jgi:hypothetical protein